MEKKLELLYPSRPFRVFQEFGDSKACTEDTPGVPITKRRVVSKVGGVCPVGYVPLYPLLGMKGHTGMDLYAPKWTILRSATEGIVEEVQLEPERGLGVGVVSTERYDMGSHGVHYAKTRQWHLLFLNVKLGDKVKIGTPIGCADSTGLSSGDHNHFELKPVERNPDGSYYNVYQSNGYYGAIDPSPFFVGYYAEDYSRLLSPFVPIDIVKNFINRFFGRIVFG